jgi:hypothetical protein
VPAKATAKQPSFAGLPPQLEQDEAPAEESGPPAE